MRPVDDSGYWLGVITGMMCSVLLIVVCGFVLGHRMEQYEKKLAEVDSREKEHEQWIEDNWKVMQTYKFFNESWEAIIELKQQDREVENGKRKKNSR